MPISGIFAEGSYEGAKVAAYTAIAEYFVAAHEIGHVLLAPQPITNPGFECCCAQCTVAVTATSLPFPRWPQAPAVVPGCFSCYRGRFFSSPIVNTDVS